MSCKVTCDIIVSCLVWSLLDFLCCMCIFSHFCEAHCAPDLGRNNAPQKCPLSMLFSPWWTTSCVQVRCMCRLLVVLRLHGRLALFEWLCWQLDSFLLFFSVGLLGDGPLQSRSSSTICFCSLLLQAISSMMSFTLWLHVVSSSSAVQIFSDASHLWWLLFLLVLSTLVISLCSCMCQYLRLLLLVMQQPWPQ